MWKSINCTIITNSKIRENTIGVASVGCSVFMYDYFNIDVLEAPHGRASAVASGVKRAKKAVE
jgi:2-oxoglutarate ferredoxin oxidoreductase subunit beta